jgi:hypothetical protein
MVFYSSNLREYKEILLYIHILYFHRTCAKYVDYKKKWFLLEMLFMWWRMEEVVVAIALKDASILEKLIALWLKNVGIGVYEDMWEGEGLNWENIQDQWIPLLFGTLSGAMPHSKRALSEVDANVLQRDPKRFKDVDNGLRLKQNLSLGQRRKSSAQSTMSEVLGHHWVAGNH